MRKFLFILLAVIFVEAGCSKENSDVFIPYEGNPSNDTTWVPNATEDAPATKLFEGLSEAPLTNIFDAAGTGVMHIDQNLDLTIPPGSITIANGTPVTSGNVRMEIRHLARRGDFVRYNRSTTSYGSILESKGAFYVKAFKEDQELSLQQGTMIEFTIKDPNPVGNTNVFYGNDHLQAPLPAGTNPFFTWKRATDSSYVIPFVQNVTEKGYHLFSTKLNWISCQNYLDSTLPETRILTTLPANFTNHNSTVFAVVKNRNIVVQMNSDYLSRSFSAPNIPVGSNIVLVSLSLIGSQYYLGFKEMTVSPDMITIVNPAPRTISEISQFLDGL